MTLPCGQCTGCRLEYSRQWAIRGYHESLLYTDNSFLTLTYDDANLPDDASLQKNHLVKFWKRFRKSIKPKKIRYIACGEYGDDFGRPHYHAIVFNHDFSDKQPVNKTLYTSEKLSKLWPFGHTTIGSVTFDSIAYVARYIMKKQKGKNSKTHYETFDPTTGEISSRTPEYLTMSRRPGIGHPWLEKYRTDVYPHDFVVVNGVKCKPPKYYDIQQMELDETEMELLKLSRKMDMASRPVTPHQLKAKKIITEQKINTNLTRKLK